MSVWLNCLFRLKIVKKNSTEIVYNEDLSLINLHILTVMKSYNGADNL